MTQDELIALAGSVQMQNYRQQPHVMSRGDGVRLWDYAGREFLDMTAGISVCCLGHSHPVLTQAISEQAGRLLHTSNLYFIEEQIRAAKAITDRCFGERVFFCNSGAEANEAALKLARRYQSVVRGAPQRQRFVATEGSFHGRSFATVGVTGQPKYHDSFGMLVEPVEFVPFGDTDAATAAIAKPDTCAFIVEPLQAEGGIRVPPPGYLAAVRDACTQHEVILIFDEVQTGVGRTGTLFAYQREDVVPDVMTLAKALAGGVPIGAVVASERAAQGLAFRPGGAVPHASTFGGNPLACAAARTVLEVVDKECLVANAESVGAHLGARLAQLAMAYSYCVQARGRGLLRGLALDRGASDIVAACRDRGLLLSVAGGTVIRFAPALIVTNEDIDKAVTILDSVLKEQAS